MTSREATGAIRTRDVRHCLVCGSEGNVVYRELTDRSHGVPGTWNLRACGAPGCGLLWLDPMPAEEDLGRLYHNYYTHRPLARAGEPRQLGITWARLPLKLLWNLTSHVLGLNRERKRLDAMYLDEDEPGSLLDVGCGNGERLCRLRDAGWNVCGVEIDPQAGKIAKDALGQSIHIGSLPEAGFPDQFFDAITMNHVIEHIYDPTEVLRECRRILKPYGRLVVVTPNAKSLLHARFKQDWAGLDPPRHLHLFSAASLTDLIRRSGCEEPVVWTTSANARHFALHSIRIGASYDLRISSRPSVKQELRTRRTQIQSTLHQRRHPDAGEELVAVVKA